jgi:alpha-tubulin suppressor-like RCC1 family protein
MSFLKKILILLGLGLLYNLSAGQPCGVVVGWGENAGGQATGIPTHDYLGGLVAPGGIVLSNVAAISAGFNHSLAVKCDGTVAGWGWNGGGKITIPTNLVGVIAVAAGSRHSLALQKNGHVVAWGDPQFDKTIVPESVTNVVAIAAGDEYSLALGRDGTIASWTGTYSPAGLSNVVAIAASSGLAGRSLALRKDGFVVEFDNHSRTATVVSGLSNVVAIAAGPHHCLALKNDGTVFGWGSNDSGETTIPAGLSNVTAIAAGGNDVPATGFSLALKSDGTVVEWGQIYSQPAKAPFGLSNVVAIAAGHNYCLALTTNQAVADSFRHH